MRNDDVAKALARVTVPEAHAAAARARRTVLDAFEAREPEPARHRRSGLRLALGVAVAAVIAGVAVASPSTGIRSLVRDAVRAAPPKLHEAPLRLPGGGTLLVRAPGSLFVLHANGTRRLLGPYREAAWSPHERFVVATAGRHLAALDPRTGRTRWSITAASNVSGARWSLEPTVPPCCRVAYLTDDAGAGRGTLNVIAGDGTGNRALAPADARVAPAWQPGSSARSLAFVDPSGAVRLVSADSGDDLANPVWRGFRPTRLAWSQDGTRLLAMNDRRLLILDAHLRTALRILRAPDGGRLVSAAFAGPGHAAVVLRRLAGGRSQIELLPGRGPGRPLDTLVGTLSGLAPSPDGRYVLVGWGAADQWLLLSTGGAATRRIAGLDARFGAAAVPVGAAWR